ncbi:MAG TPA: choice-of-anchor D domain-containing protein [Vicinamibacterales bacterium]
MRGQGALGRAYAGALAIILMASGVMAQPTMTTAVGQREMTAIARDPVSGALYFAADRPGTISRVSNAPAGVLIAGTPGGSLQDGVPAAQAAVFPGRNGLAVDGAGNIFFSEPALHRIRRIDAATTVITTIAGTGETATDSNFFDGSNAIYTPLSAPGALAFNPVSGDLYVADETLDIVYRITGNGVPITAGNGLLHRAVGGNPANTSIYVEYNWYNPFGYAGDNGPALDAKLNHPRGLAFDASANLFIADTGNNAVRRVAASNGFITTVAGTGVPGWSGDGGPATAAQLFMPSGVSADTAGTLWIADTANHRIRAVYANGHMDTYLGDGIARFGPFSLAYPTGVLVSGAIAIVDSQNRDIAMFDPNADSSEMTTIAEVITGKDDPGYVGDGSPGGDAVNQPMGIVFDRSGNAFFSDSGNSRVRRVDAVTRAVTTVVGSGVPGYGGDAGDGRHAQLNCPAGLAFGAAGDLFIADTCANVVRRVSPGTGGLVTGAAGETISTYAGTGVRYGTIDGAGGPATAARLNAPTTLAMFAGTLAIGAPALAEIREVKPDGTMANGDLSDVEADAFTADALADLIVADGSNGIACYGASQAQFGGLGITGWGGAAMDAAGRLYLIESDASQRIYRYAAPGGGAICSAGLDLQQTLAVGGSGATGYSGDGGAAALATMNQPRALAVDGGGDVWIADTGNNVIRRVQQPSAAVTVDPASVDFGTRGLLTESATKAVTATDSGSLAATFLAATLGGDNPGDFAIVADGCLSAVLAPGGLCQIAVAFMPTAPGTRRATLQLNDTASGSPQTIALTGQGVSLDVNPASIVFAAQPLTLASAPALVTMTNDAAASVSIQSLAFTGQNGGDFSTTSDGCTGSALGPHGSCTVGVVFTPQATGMRAATLSIASSAQDSPRAVSVSGTGSALAPAVTIAPTAVAFPQTAAGSSTAPVVVMVTNSGSAPLSITGTALSGNQPADFVLANNTCSGAMLAPGQTCSFGIAFAPIEACSATTAAVTVTDNAADSPQSVSLSGRSVAGATGPFQATLFCTSHAAQPQELAAAPDGNVWFDEHGSVFAPGAIAHANATAGVISEDATATLPQWHPSALSILPDGSYAYIESRGGGFAEWYDIFNPLGDEIQQPVQIPGPSGPGPDGSFWLTNRFTCADNILFQHFAPNAATVSLVPTSQWIFFNANRKACLAPSFVAPGPEGLEWIGTTNQSADVGTNAPNGFVRVTMDNQLVDFTPSDAAPLAATIGPDGHMWALVANLGTQACSLERLTADAAGTPIAMPPNVVVLGCFSIVSAPDHRLWMTGSLFNGTAFVQALVAYAPAGGWSVYPVASIGTANVFLAAGPDEGLWFDAIPSEVGRFDLGGGPSRAYVAPQSISFEPTANGEPSASQTVVVRSTGTQALSIGGVALTGPDADQFIVQFNGCPGAVLAPGQTCLVRLTSRPTRTGIHHASLVINDNDGFSPQIVSLADYDLPAGPTIDPPNPAFPAAIVGHHGTTVTFTLTNPFDRALAIQSVSLDANGHDFTMIANGCLNATVAANGGTCTVDVRFDPTAAGTRTATLSFTDAANPPVQVVTLTGKGQTTSGGTGSCGCDSTGLFVDPAIVYPQVIQSFGTTGTSPHGAYTLDVQLTADNKPLAFVITRKGSTTPLVTIGAPNPSLTAWPASVEHAWGFSPDDDRFVLHYATYQITGNVTTDWIDTIALYDLTSASPGVPVHAPITLPIAPEGSASGPEGSAAFSPGGAYLLTAQHQSTSTGQSIALNLVGRGGQQVFQHVWNPASAPANPDDQARSAFWGFAPDEQSFAYYVEEPGNDPILRLVSLPAGSAGPIHEFHYDHAVATLVQFAPCGEVIAIVHQDSNAQDSNPVTISLYSTRPADAGHGAIGEKGDLPIKSIQIHAGSANYTADVQDYPNAVTLAPNANAGSCDPPTASGDAGGSDAPAVAVAPTFKDDFDTSPPPFIATLGQLYSYTFKANGSPDPQFDFLTNTCGFLTIDKDSGGVSGTPQTAFASCTYSVTAFNGDGNADSPLFTVTMAPVTPPSGGGGGGGPYVPDDGDVTSVSPSAASSSPNSSANPAATEASPQLPAPTTVVLPHARGRIVLNADIAPAVSTFTYTESDAPAGPIGSLLFAGLSFSFNAVDAATGSPVTTLIDPAVATIVYRASDLQSARISDPTTLSVYWWNGTAWIDQMPCHGCALDASAGTLTVRLSRLGDYVLAASLPPRTLTVTAVPVTAAAGTPFSGIVATFTPFNPGDLAGYYTATINWGDGQYAGGSISSTGAGTFAISGAHAWMSSGSFTIGIAVQQGSPAGSTQTTATVSGAGQPPQFTAAAAPLTATVGAPYSYSFAATGAPAPTYALAAGAPAWLSIGAATGAVAGTPPRGTASFTYSVIASNGVLPNAAVGPFVVSVMAPPQFTAAAPPLTATVGAPYSYSFVATGAPAPTYALAAGAPAWLSVGAATGAVAGTPPSGTASFAYSVIASNGVSPNAVAGPFTVTVAAASNAAADVAVSLTAPAKAAIGSTVAYSIVVTNNGPGIAKKVALVMLAGPGAWYVSSAPAPLLASEGLWTWTFASLAPGQSATITLRVKATVAGTLLGAAVIVSDTRDPKLGNNAALTATVVR